MTPIPETLTVKSVETAAEEIKELTLIAPDGGELPRWEPGAHLEIELPNGLVRHYSLCGDVADRSAWRIAVLREPASRGGSQCVHDDLHPGSTVRLRRIRNNFPFKPGDHQVFVAGGIGITPILPMVRECIAEGRAFTLHYCGRSTETMAFLDELPRDDVVHVVTTGPDGVLDLNGVVEDAPEGADVYCCGPSGLINALQEVADARGLRFRSERFKAESSTSEDPPEGERRPFEVVLGSCGKSVQVPADRSILEVLEEHGVEVDFSCREGTCGTCEVNVLSGTPDHRDDVLDEEERASGATMMLCVSRSLGPSITVDL